VENQKATSVKSTALLWIAFTAALALVAVALLHLGVLGGRSDSTAPDAIQSAPAATQAIPSARTEPAAGQGGGYSLTNVFIYEGRVAGDTNFRPSEVLTGGCRTTERGSKALYMTLFQDMEAQSPLTLQLMDAYTAGSIVNLTNVHLVPNDNPYLLADARIVPNGTPGPFPPYLDVTQAKFRWAQPVSEEPNAAAVGDPLIVCNYV
jgi:hypothetical protein